VQKWGGGGTDVDGNAALLDHLLLFWAPVIGTYFSTAHPSPAIYAAQMITQVFTAHYSTHTHQIQPHRILVRIIRPVVA